MHINYHSTSYTVCCIPKILIPDNKSKIISNVIGFLLVVIGILSSWEPNPQQMSFTQTNMHSTHNVQNNSK